MLENGSLVDGKYRILGKCGQGGMSVVYIARNERANRTWAIKEIRREGVADFALVRQSLLMETELLKKLRHPHLPGIIDVLEQEDSILIVMDFIEGRTLLDRVKEGGAQPQQEVIGWAKQLCEVLGYLHAQHPPIIYRDMKPANVMLKPDGNVVLLDFGTAREYKKLGQEDTVCLGTRGYAAPEQYGGSGQSDARTDIYCLGATLYHLLTGHNPCTPPYEIVPIRCWDAGLSAGLEAVIRKCVQNDPRDRYQSCEELQYALENYEQWDRQYQKKRRIDLCRFAVPAVLSLVFGVAALGFRRSEMQMMRNSYESYLEAAENSADKEEELENYRKAISLDPSRSDAYLGLLQEGFLDDGVFTVEESAAMRAVLIDYGDGKVTNETALKKNEAGYDQFAYEMGIAYYYKYEEKNNKKNAKGYFRVAAQSDYLEESKIRRAEKLYAISDYYAQIGVPDETGDTSVTCRDYWEDLTELSDGNLVEEDNERTALILYEELAGQLAARAWDFREDGVTRAEMEAQLNKIRTHMETDFENVSAGSREEIRDEMEKLQDTVQHAERMVASAFAKEEG